MSQILEVLMLVLFGLSWPFNIAKSWKAKTAKGKSLLFEVCILVGYICGIAGKFITGNVTSLKVPAALNAMSAADVKASSEEGEVISTIAIATSSIITP